MKKNISFIQKDSMFWANTWFVLGKQTIYSGLTDRLFWKYRCFSLLKEYFLFKVLLVQSDINAFYVKEIVKLLPS